jgi:hypothetical protein
MTVSGLLIMYGMNRGLTLTLLFVFPYRLTLLIFRRSLYWIRDILGQ